MSNNEFGAYLRKLRRSKGLTQEKLAQKLNLTGKAVSRWENGASKPRGDYLLRLCALLDTSVDKLLSAGHANAVISDTAVEDTMPLQMKYEHLNFIPKEQPETGNYLCTWTLQRQVANQIGLPGRGTIRQRDVMNEELLFGEESYYHVYKTEDRHGLYFLLDDGWDVPYGTASDNPKSRDIFGSLDPDPAKFGTLGADSTEILSALTKKAIAHGYKGLGLWVSPQRPNLGIGVADDPEAARDYWIEKAKQSAAAGIAYWKVDWGKGGNDLAYRTMMTDCVKKYAPKLLIEHAVPLTPFEVPTSPDDELALRMKETLKISDYFRTYDLCSPFGDALTVCRIANLLKGFDPSALRFDVQGVITVESQPLVAAGLGFSLGVMEYSKTTEAVLRWQRIAPPFSVRHGALFCSEEEITDRLYFSTAPIWWLKQYLNREVEISTPMVLSRNTRLPKVNAPGLLPRIAACCHPKTHALAVSSMKRTVDPNREIIALADVTAYPDRLSAPIGLFGCFNSVTLEFSKDIPKKAVVYAQCLLSDAAVDITKEVTVNGRSLTVPGRLLRKLGHSVTETEYNYEPAVLIKLCRI